MGEAVVVTGPGPGVEVTPAAAGPRKRREKESEIRSVKCSQERAEKPACDRRPGGLGRDGMRRGKLRKGVPGKKCRSFPFQRREKPVRWVRPPAALGRAGGVRGPQRSEADQRGKSETARRRRQKSRKTRPGNRQEAGALEGWARDGMPRGKLPKEIPGKKCHSFPFQEGEQSP